MFIETKNKKTPLNSQSKLLGKRSYLFIKSKNKKIPVLNHN